MIGNVHEYIFEENMVKGGSYWKGNKIENQGSVVFKWKTNGGNPDIGCRVVLAPVAGSSGNVNSGTQNNSSSNDDKWSPFGRRK